MPEQLRNVFLEGMDVSVESFIKSRPPASEPYLISAAFECLRLHVPCINRRSGNLCFIDPIIGFKPRLLQPLLSALADDGAVRELVYAVCSITDAERTLTGTSAPLT